MTFPDPRHADLMRKTRDMERQLLENEHVRRKLHNRIQVHMSWRSRSLLGLGTSLLTRVGPLLARLLISSANQQGLVWV